jgi:hydrogenase-4 component E
MTTWLYDLNALVLGLFVLCAIGMAVMRQVGACLQVFVIQSLLLAASAFLLGGSPWSWHLFALGCVTVASKAILIPWILRALVPGEVYARRELSQTIGVPAILLATVALVLAGYAFALPLNAAAPSLSAANVSLGAAGLFIALLSLAVRREAVPQVLGILAMENGAFLAGIAIAPDFPLIAELAIAFDVPLLAFIVALLTRAVYHHIGSTEIAKLSTLRETL